MKNKVVLTLAVDTETGDVNVLIGDGIKLPKKAESGNIAEVRLGGSMSYPIALQSFLITLKHLKNMIMLNPELKDEDKVGMEQSLYDLVNITVGGFLDTEFPLINSKASLTEEACAEYGLDPKTATAEELLEAENRFIDEFPERAGMTAEMELKEIPKK